MQTDRKKAGMNIKRTDMLMHANMVCFREWREQVFSEMYSTQR